MESTGNARSLGYGPVAFAVALLAAIWLFGEPIPSAAERERMDRANAVPDRVPCCVSAP